MPRILAIDYGKKRCGLAWTDPLQLIATGIGTVSQDDLLKRLEAIFQQEEVDTIVLGYPTRHDGSDSHVTADIRELAQNLKTQYPLKNVELWDERFTSKMASEAIRKSGAKRKKRQDKALVDEVSAVLILQDFLESRGNS